MADIITLKDRKTKEPVYPRTHIEAVIDDTNTPLGTIMQMRDEEVDGKLTELGSEVNVRSNEAVSLKRVTLPTLTQHEYSILDKYGNIVSSKSAYTVNEFDVKAGDKLYFDISVECLLSSNFSLYALVDNEDSVYFTQKGGAEIIDVTKHVITIKRDGTFRYVSLREHNKVYVINTFDIDNIILSETEGLRSTTNMPISQSFLDNVSIEEHENSILNGYGVITNHNGFKVKEVDVYVGDIYYLSINDILSTSYCVFSLLDNEDTVYFKGGVGSSYNKTKNIIRITKDGKLLLSCPNSGEQNLIFKVNDFNLDNLIAKSIEIKLDKSLGKNLFNIASALDNTMLYNNGGTTTNATTYANYVTSDYIEIEANKYYSSAYGANGYRKVCFYNYSKTCIGEEYTQQECDKFLVPAGAKYARITFTKDYLDKAMVAQVNGISFFEPFDEAGGYTNKIVNNVINSNEDFGNTLFTSKYNAIGDTTDNAHRTCFKRLRGKNVVAVEFAVGTYASHTYFCAFDSNDAIIASYSLTGANTTSEKHHVDLGDDVYAYSVMTLASFFDTSYLTEVTRVNGDYVIARNNELEQENSHLLKAIKDGELERWSELQFGMFIHWGVYSALGGAYTGEDINGNQISRTDGDEWMLYTFKIPRNTYKWYQRYFTAEKWNPDLICEMALSLGMKYIIITIRHHEGFSLVESDYTDWDISTAGATNKDVIMQLKKACDRHHIKFGIYVSALMSWTDNGGYPQQLWNNGTDPYTYSQHKEFVEKQCKYMNQLVEMFDPYEIWYDGGSYVNIPNNLRQIFQKNQDLNYPVPLHNDRGAFHTKADFHLAEDALPDNPEDNEKLERVMQYCGSWGYNPIFIENNLWSRNAILWDIFETVSRGYNYVANISPKGDGEIPAKFVTRFAQLSAWLKKYTFVNGCKRLFYYAQPSFGRTLYRNNELFLIVLPNRSSTINLDSVYTGNIKTIELMTTDTELQMSYTINGDYSLTISNLPLTTTDYFIVIKITFTSPAICNDYNIIDSTISPLSLVRTQYVAWNKSGVNIDGIYVMGVGLNKCVSRFKWGGTNGSYHLSLTATLTNAQTFVVNLYDDNGALLSSDNSMDNNNLTTNSTFTLENGKMYLLEIVRNDTNNNSKTEISNIEFSI